MTIIDPDVQKRLMEIIDERIAKSTYSTASVSSGYLSGHPNVYVPLPAYTSTASVNSPLKDCEDEYEFERKLMRTFKDYTDRVLTTDSKVVSMENVSLVKDLGWVDENTLAAIIPEVKAELVNRLAELLMDIVEIDFNSDLMTCDTKVRARLYVQSRK